MNAGQRAWSPRPNNRVAAPGILWILAVFALSACGPAAPPGPLTPQVITVYSTAAAQPWLKGLYDCASGQSAVLSIVNQADPAMIVLRLGGPTHLTTPAFQVGTEDILVVVNHAQPFSALSAEQVRGLFSGKIDDWGQIDPAQPGQVQVWVFAPDQDVQQVFTKTLQGDPIVSSARLATSPDEMSRAIANDLNAIGILARHSATGKVAGVFTAISVPVLAITRSEPQTALKNLLACLQNK